MNEAGVVVGETYGTPPGVRPIVYLPQFGPQLLPGFTNAIGRAHDVNDHGVVVGMSAFLPGDADFWDDAFLSVAGFTWTLPEAVPNSAHHAHAVNNQGQVAGEFFGPGGSSAFLWSAATGTIDLGGFPPFKATVLLNDRGDIIANFSTGTVPSFGPSPVLSVPDVSDLPAGRYRFFAIVDRASNGVLDADVVDVVDVHIVGTAIRYARY